MADSKKQPSGKQFGEGSMTGTVPSGSEMNAEGSSVEVDGDVATAEEIPSTEEILSKKQDNKGGTGHLPFQYPAPPHAPSGGAAGGAPEAKPEEDDPNKRMADIE